MLLVVVILLSWIATVLACPTGDVLCPANTPSAGVCVPSDETSMCQLYVWNNIYAEPTKRATALLGNLTLSEKIALLATGETDVPNYVERLGLQPPATTECLHGVCRQGYTVFPQSISLAATFDPDLLARIGTAIGTELRGAYNEARKEPIAKQKLPICLGPQINIARDPRWGRAQETYGEDPFLSGELAKAYIRGLQGDDARVTLAGTVVKHFDAYNGATSRGSYSISEVTLSNTDWAETYLPHWQAAVSEKPVGVMCSYNSLCLVDAYNRSCRGPSHGVPACANPELLQSLLRDEWHFDGFVMSDAGAVQYIETDHRYAHSQVQAASLAIKAGCDLDLGGGDADGQCHSFSCLTEAVDEGLVAPADVDRALQRQLLARVEVGALDPPEYQAYGYLNSSNSINTQRHRQLALEAAIKSVVLLKNSANTLPLNPHSMSLPGELAVVGPNADANLYGNYNGENNRTVTILAGLKVRMPLLTYHYGVNVSAVEAPLSGKALTEAVEAAANAEVTVAVMGLDQTQEFEGGTRSDIVLPGFQSMLLDELRVKAKTLVVVLVGGSAMAVPWVDLNADATLWVGYGGEEAGTALASVLFGDVSPSGKLPMTWYTGIDQLPPYASMDMRASPGRTYRFLQTKPLFSFGFGLSYARMDVQLEHAAPTKLARCEALPLSIQIVNNGPIASDEVLQVFVVRTGSLARRTLGAFQRTNVLTVGATKRLNITVPMGAFMVQQGLSMMWVSGTQKLLLSLRGVDNPTLSFSVALDGPSGSCDNLPIFV